MSFSSEFRSNRKSDYKDYLILGGVALAGVGVIAIGVIGLMAVTGVIGGGPQVASRDNGRVASPASRTRAASRPRTTEEWLDYYCRQTIYEAHGPFLAERKVQEYARECRENMDMGAFERYVENARGAGSLPE